MGGICANVTYEKSVPQPQPQPHNELWDVVSEVVQKSEKICASSQPDLEYRIARFCKENACKTAIVRGISVNLEQIKGKFAETLKSPQTDCYQAFWGVKYCFEEYTPHHGLVELFSYEPSVEDDYVTKEYQKCVQAGKEGCQDKLKNSLTSE